jgi:nitrogen regulatory protein PII
MPEEQTFQSKLRMAVFDGVSDADVAAVVKSITEKAKAGDPASTRLFFDYVLGAKTKPTQVTVNNHFQNVEQAAKFRRVE